MNSGKDSNCVHWSYATLTGTPMSMLCSTVLIALLQRGCERRLYPAPRPANALSGRRGNQDFFLLAVALPPLRPAAFFCAVVPPWRESPPEPELLPPCFEAFGEFAIFAARCLDMPLSFRASYCFSFLTCALPFGIAPSSRCAGSTCIHARALGLRNGNVAR